MKLNVPEQDRDVLRKWLLDETGDFQRVVDELGAQQPVLMRDVLADRLAEKVGRDQTEMREFVRMSLSLLATLSGAKDPSATLDDLCASIGIPEERRKSFKERAEALRATKSLRLSRKAVGVITDNPHIYKSSRSLSEWRPVFDDEASGDTSPAAVVVMHQVKIAFRSRSEQQTQEIFIACDRDDLVDLKKMIDRALRKHDEMTRVVQGLQIPVISS